MASATDYIPNSDADFSAWIHNLVTYANANLAGLGLTAADLTPLQTAVTGWDTVYPAHVAAQASAQSARQAKDDSRADVEGAVRPLVGKLQSTTTVSDAQRQALGITVRATSKTAVSVPTTRPVAQVDTGQRLRHAISFVDELTPTTRAKPDGVTGCEIWTKVGDPAPTGPGEVAYLALDTRTPYVVEFNGSEAGKTAYYMLRWINTRGERGPWSQTVSGTITN